MPSRDIDILHRGFGYLENDHVTSYASATAESTADAVEFSQNNWIGFRFFSSQYTVRSAACRFDLRRFIGGKVTAVTAFMRANPTIDVGTTFTVEVRSHTRSAPNGKLAAADHQTPAELAAQTLYASATLTGGNTATYTLTESGTNLIDAINTALAGTGILDVVVCTANHRANTPPSGTNGEYFIPEAMSLTPSNRSFYLDMTVDSETVNLLCLSRGVDIGLLAVTSSSWSNVLTGVSPSLDNDANIRKGPVVREGSGFYSHRALYFKVDFSGLDQARDITGAKFVFFGSIGGGLEESHDTWTNEEPWQIRRYDKSTGIVAGDYRTQTQLGLLDLILEFEPATLDYGDYPPDAPDTTSTNLGNAYNWFLDGGQTLIDIIKEYDADTGFYVHSKRMITGTAPPTNTADGYPAGVAVEAVSEWRGNAAGVIIEYDTGQDLLIGPF